MLVSGLPVITAQNILEQFSYMNIGRLVYTAKVGSTGAMAVSEYLGVGLVSDME